MGGLVVSPRGGYKTLVRHGLNTRAKRLTLVAGLPRAVRAAARKRARAAHRDQPARRAGGIDCFFVGRLHGAKGLAWQITAIDTHSSFDWAELVSTPPAGPTVEQTSALARRVAADLHHAGWQLERVLSDNGNEFGRQAFGSPLPAGTLHTQIRSGRPQTNRPRLHRTTLEECWRPAFARYLQVRSSGLKRDLARYLSEYTYDREHHGRITAGRRPADLVYGARRMEPR